MIRRGPAKEAMKYWHTLGYGKSCRRDAKWEKPDLKGHAAHNSIYAEMKHPEQANPVEA